MSRQSGDTGILIGDLIQTRLVELGLTKAKLVERWGYAKIAKGIRRLNQLETGSFKPSPDLLAKLAEALEMPGQAIQNAFAATQEKVRQIEDENRQKDWDEWCDAFQPHAILTTENVIPRPIHIVAVVGAERILRIDFDTNASEDQWPQLVRRTLPKSVVAFGNVNGFVINYSPHRATRFDLGGQVVEFLPKAVRLGAASFSIRGQDITERLRAMIQSS